MTNDSSNQKPETLTFGYNTLTVGIINKFIAAFEAYGLEPNEAVAAVAPVFSSHPKTGLDARSAIFADGLELTIGTRVIIDQERVWKAHEIMRQFMEDFIREAGIDSNVLDYEASQQQKGVLYYSNNGIYFHCDNFENIKTRDGNHRSANDVWHALDRMIAAKQKQAPRPEKVWAKS